MFSTMLAINQLSSIIINSSIIICGKTANDVTKNAGTQERLPDGDLSRYVCMRACMRVFVYAFIHYSYLIFMCSICFYRCKHLSYALC